MIQFTRKKSVMGGDRLGKNNEKNMPFTVTLPPEFSSNHPTMTSVKSVPPSTANLTQMTPEPLKFRTPSLSSVLSPAKTPSEIPSPLSTNPQVSASFRTLLQPYSSKKHRQQFKCKKKKNDKSKSVFLDDRHFTMKVLSDSQFLMQPNVPTKTQRQSKRDTKKKHKNSIFQIRSKLNKYGLLIIMVFFLLNINAMKVPLIELVSEETKFNQGDVVRLTNKIDPDFFPGTYYTGKIIHFDSQIVRIDNKGNEISISKLKNLGFEIKLATEKERIEYEIIQQKYLNEQEIKKNSDEETLVPIEAKAEFKVDDVIKLEHVKEFLPTIYGRITNDTNFDSLKVYIFELYALYDLSYLVGGGYKISNILTCNKGDVVKVRNNSKQVWEVGVVTELHSGLYSVRIKVQPYGYDFALTYAWNQIERVSLSERMVALSTKTFTSTMVKIFILWIILCLIIGNINPIFIWTQSPVPLYYFLAALVTLLLTQLMAILINLKYFNSKILKREKKFFPPWLEFYKLPISIWLIAPWKLTIPGYTVTSSLMIYGTFIQYPIYHPTSNMILGSNIFANVLNGIGCIGLLVVAWITLEVDKNMKDVITKPWVENNLAHEIGAGVAFITFTIYQFLQTIANVAKLWANIFPAGPWPIVILILQIITNFTTIGAYLELGNSGNSKYQWLATLGICVYYLLSGFVTTFVLGEGEYQ